MKPRFARAAQLRFAVALAFTILLAATLLLATPQGRAWAQSAFRFFAPSESNTRPVATLFPTLVANSPESAPASLPSVPPQPPAALPFQDTCGSQSYPRCSVDEIRALVEFPVNVLATLPQGWEFVGATGGPERVSLFYQSQAGLLELAQGPASYPDPFTWPVGSDAAIESVTVGNAIGEYVQGMWAASADNAGSVAWDSNIPHRALRWEADGIRYTMQFLPAKSDEGVELDQAMIVEYAAHLAGETSVATAAVLQPNAAIEEVAAAAGFPVVEPSWLPERYTFVGAEYAAARNAVCLYYRYPGSQGAPDLVLVESPGALSLQDILMPPQSYNGVQIDIPVHTENTTVGGAADNLALYASNGLDLNPLCNSQSIISNHALLWQSGGKSYALSAMLDAYDGRGFLTSLEMRRIAEGLTGVQTIPADALDPGYLPSVEAAETLAGFEVKAPSQMPADVHFAYAVYRDANAPLAPNALANGTPEVILVYFSDTFDSLGRRHNYLFFQNTVAPNTLEELAQGGGEWATVRGQPAVYSQSCWDETTNGGDAACFMSLSWFDENGLRFDLEAYLPGALDKETFLAIAEGVE